MRFKSMRFWLVVLATLLLSGHATVTSAHGTPQPTAPAQNAIDAPNSGSFEHACAEPVAVADCHDHCLTSSRSDEPSGAIDAPATSAMVPLALHHIRMPVVSARLVIASAPLVVGPPLTILYRNLRN